MSKELEAPSLEAIRKSATTFEAQCATQSTGCALQARFLKNIAVQYEKAKRQAPSAPSSRPITVQHVSSNELQRGRNTSFPDPTNSLTDTAQADPSIHCTQLIGHSDVSSSAQGMAHAQSDMNSSTHLGYETEFSSWAFDSTDQWEAMFANAGYRIYDGTFVAADVVTEGLPR